MAKPASKRELSCIPCKSECCRSITIELDTPVGKKDYDEARWFVLHKDVTVYIDTDNKWNVEFRTPCLALLPDNRCSIYAVRPAICELYPKLDEACVFEDNPVKRMFTKVEEIDEYYADKKERRTKKRIRKAKKKAALAAI
jgi:Fe-S-cluster containining protein